MTRNADHCRTIIGKNPLSQLNIENLSKFTEHSNLSQARFVKDLLDLNPRGKLDKFLYEEDQFSTKIIANLFDFSTNAKNRIPGIKKLDGVINLNLNDKVFNLIMSDSNGLSINFPLSLIHI